MIRTDNMRLTDKVRDLECRSMRSNLLFFAIDEYESEDCESKIINMFKEDLQIEDIGTEALERVHRIGPKKGPGVPRPIVAKFLQYKDKERIHRAAPKLKRKKIGISEQYQA